MTETPRPDPWEQVLSHVSAAVDSLRAALASSTPAQEQP